MTRFRKIDPRFWGDEKIEKLTLEEKAIAIYLITSQSNRIGFFKFSPAFACEQLKFGKKIWEKRFHRVCKILGWQWDEENKLLFLPTWWKYNQPENENNLIGNLKDLADVPNSYLVDTFCNNLTYLKPSFHETFRKRCRNVRQTLPEPYPKRSPSQEQEQEHKQKQDGVAGERLAKVESHSSPPTTGSLSPAGAFSEAPLAEPPARQIIEESNLAEMVKTLADDMAVPKTRRLRTEEELTDRKALLAAQAKILLAKGGGV